MQKQDFYLTFGVKDNPNIIIIRPNFDSIDNNVFFNLWKTYLINTFDCDEVMIIKALNLIKKTEHFSTLHSNRSVFYLYKNKEDNFYASIEEYPFLYEFILNTKSGFDKECIDCQKDEYLNKLYHEFSENYSKNKLSKSKEYVIEVFKDKEKETNNTIPEQTTKEDKNENKNENIIKIKKDKILSFKNDFSYIKNGHNKMVWYCKLTRNSSMDLNKLLTKLMNQGYFIGK